MSIQLNKSNMLLFYKEFGTPNAPSLRDFFEENPYDAQDKIIDYLEKGEVKLTAPSVCKDAFTGKIVAGSKCIMTDGEYSWENTLPHYVRQYNLRLPEEFVGKIMGIGFTAATLPNAE